MLFLISLHRQNLPYVFDPIVSHVYQYVILPSMVQLYMSLPEQQLAVQVVLRTLILCLDIWHL